MEDHALGYSIDHILETSWDWSDWEGDSLCAYAVGTIDATQTVTIPKGYDRLAILIAPTTEVPSADTEYNTFDDTAEDHILDDWEEGTYLMRVSDLYDILHG